MSSITFLVSAVFTIFILHALDESSMATAIEGVDLNAQASIQKDDGEFKNIILNQQFIQSYDVSENHADTEEKLEDYSGATQIKGTIEEKNTSSI